MLSAMATATVTLTAMIEATIRDMASETATTTVMPTLSTPTMMVVENVTVLADDDGVSRDPQ